MDARELDEKLARLKEKLDDNFVKDIKAATPEAMKELVVKLSQESEKIDFERETNAARLSLKSKLSDINAGFRDTKKAVQRKLQYILLTMQERGTP